MKVLIFGKTGQVATELAALAAAQSGSDLTLQMLGRDEADLSDQAACAAWIKSTDAQAVINVAAYTAVDLAEEDETLATLINGADLPRWPSGALVPSVLHVRQLRVGGGGRRAQPQTDGP